MEIRNLKTFLQVVESGSFTRAAEILGYTQATVSIHISQLEEELGCPLFDRIGHSVFLTSRGQLLQQHALEISNRVQILQEDFRREEELSGQVHMASSDSICEKMVKDHYTDFYRAYPQIHLVFSTGSTLDLLELLERNEADVLFTLDQHVYQQNFIIAKESPVPLRFVAAASSPLAERRQIPLEEILRHPLFLTESGTSYRKILDDRLAQMSLAVKPVLETGRTDVIAGCVASGIGLSFLPEFAVRPFVERGELAVLEVADFDATIWKQLIYRRDKWVSAALRAFLDFVMEHEFDW